MSDTGIRAIRHRGSQRSGAKAARRVSSTLSASKALSRSGRQNLYYYAILLLPILYFVIFRYGPMAGNVLAFKRFVNGQGIWGGEWVGLRYFNLFMRDPAFWRAFRNNMILSLMTILLAFPAPIIFALLLNEVRGMRWKKTVQTVSYLPHFISVVVVVGMIKEVLSPATGVINQLIEATGGDTVNFLNRAEFFRAIYVSSEIWQHMGWNAIIYLAALAGVDPQLYEAASVDGAGRFQKAMHITLPGIMPAVVITLILAVGRMLFIGFEKVLLLYSPMTRETADILSTFVFRMGIEQGNYSYATAVGLFNGIIGLILVGGSNLFARKYSETSLW